MLIELENLTVTARGKTLLDGINLSIAKGEHLLVSGPSGSGKSTLLSVLVGGHAPTEGVYRYDGRTVDHRTIGTVRTRMAFIGQEPVLGAPTVREALTLPFTFRANRHLHPADADIDAVLASVRLDTSILGQMPDTVSGGEKQRLVIARALLLQKDVFLVDEATSALDPESKRAVLELFRKTEATIVSVSHDTDWQALAGRTVTMRDGRLIP